MTGYQSKKAAAQGKLTVDREQLEYWLQSLKDIDALHHPAEPESVDAQKAIADMGQALAQPAQEPVADAFMVHLYNLGYKSGHHDTVEGRYIDIYVQDMDTYHSDFVSDYLAETCNTTSLAAQPVGQAPCIRHCEATAFQIVIKNLRGEIERMKAAQRKPLTDEQARVVLGLERLPGVAVMRDVKRIEAAHGIKE
jgi:hypothetical protein